MNFQATAVVVYEAQFTEFVHEETYAGPGRSDHLRQSFLTDLGDNRLRRSTLLSFVKSLTRAQVDGAEDKIIAWSGGGNDRKLKGNDYLQQFALPNFFFFVTTAYNILRHRGVPIGKRDFLGPVNWL